MFKTTVLIWFGLTLMKRLPPAPEWPDPEREAHRLPACRLCETISGMLFGV